MRLCKFLFLFAGLHTAALAQWDLQQSHTTADLRAIDAVSGSVAWATGAGGTVLRTTDGGSTWEQCAVPPGAKDLELGGVQAFDGKTALVLSTGKGERSRVYKTTDGCRTWEQVLTNPDPEGAWGALHFRYTPPKGGAPGFFGAGVLVGQPVNGEFAIFTSRDYGSTWKTIHDDEAYEPGPSAWAKPGERIFALSNGALTPTAEKNGFAFVTGGQAGARLLFPQGHSEEWESVNHRYTFTTVTLPTLAGGDAGAFAVGARSSTDDQSDLMIVGGSMDDPERGVAMFVPHTGMSYRKLLGPKVIPAQHPPSGLRTAVAFDPGSGAWIAVGPNGTDVSHDDGRNWTPVKQDGSDSPDRNWQAMSLPFVVGPGGRIGRLRGVSR